MQPPNPGGRPENRVSGEIGLMDEEAPIFEKRPLSDDPPEMESVCRIDVRADPPCKEWPPLEIATQPPNPGGRLENQGPGMIGLTDCKPPILKKGHYRTTPLKWSTSAGWTSGPTHPVRNGPRWRSQRSRQIRGVVRKTRVRGRSA